MSTIASTGDTFVGTAATSALFACVLLTVVTAVMLVAVWRKR